MCLVLQNWINRKVTVALPENGSIPRNICNQFTYKSFLIRLLVIVCDYSLRTGFHQQYSFHRRPSGLSVYNKSLGDIILEFLFSGSFLLKVHPCECLATNEIEICVKTNLSGFGQNSREFILQRTCVTLPTDRVNSPGQLARLSGWWLLPQISASTFWSSVKIPKACYISLGTAHWGSMHRVMTYMNTFLSQALKKIFGNQAEKPYFPFVL